MVEDSKNSKPTIHTTPKAQRDPSARPKKLVSRTTFRMRDDFRARLMSSSNSQAYREVKAGIYIYIHKLILFIVTSKVIGFDGELKFVN